MLGSLHTLGVRDRVLIMYVNICKYTDAYTDACTTKLTGYTCHRLWIKYVDICKYIQIEMHTYTSSARIAHMNMLMSTVVIYNKVQNSSDNQCKKLFSL